MRYLSFRFAASSVLKLTAIVLTLFIVAHARGQFDEAPSGQTKSKDKGTTLDQPTTQKVSLGVRIRAVGGPCRGISVSFPVPMDWPEQKVQIDQQDFSPGIHQSSDRILSGGEKQMVVSVPSLASGEEAHAVITFEVTRELDFAARRYVDL